MLSAILVVGSGVSLVFFMNLLWDDNTANSYVDLNSDSDSDSDSDIDNHTGDSFLANSPL